MNELLQLYKENIAKMSIKDAVYESLRQAIIMNILPSGYRLKDSEIAQLFKVSRSPVREALQILIKRKLVDFTGNNGFTVRELTIMQCLDIVNYVKYLRIEIMRIAEKNITLAQIEELETKILTIEMVRQFSKEDRLTDCYSIYQQFYYEIAKTTANKYLCNELDLAQEKLLMMHYRYPKEMKEEFSSGHYPFYHKQIIDSLKGKNHMPAPHELVKKYCNMMLVVSHMYNLRQDWE